MKNINCAALRYVKTAMRDKAVDLIFFQFTWLETKTEKTVLQILYTYFFSNHATFLKKKVKHVKPNVQSIFFPTHPNEMHLVPLRDCWQFLRYIVYWKHLQDTGGQAMTSL